MLVRGGGRETCFPHVLAHSERGYLGACSNWKGGDGPSSGKSSLFAKEPP